MTIVFVNGCFDVLHRGHLELFDYAQSLGYHLIVAIDTDEKVRRDKGARRPVNNLKDRKYFLSCLESVDEVLDFSSAQELEDLIKSLTPDIMVVGSDWRGKPIVGSQYAQEVKFFERIDGYSTTKIIQYSSHR